MSHFYDKKAFHLASELIPRIYDATNGFPKEESFGLTLRLRRAAIDVAAGISEGVSKGARMAAFTSLNFSQSRLDDVRACIVNSEELGYLSEEAIQPLLTDCARIGTCLKSLIESMFG